MIVTEEEAKTKRCQESYGPVSTAAVTTMMQPTYPGGNVAYFQPAFPPMPTNCIGSACMAWRWQHRTIGEAKAGTGHGYCGKAGVP